MLMVYKVAHKPAQHFGIMQDAVEMNVKGKLPNHAMSGI